MPELTDEQREVITSTPVVALSTVGPKGTPQTTATWFLLDDDGLVKISLSESRQKLKNLMRSSGASLLFVNPQNPFQTVEIRGAATIEPDADGMLIAKVNAKYSANVRDFDQPGEQRYAVTFHPEKVLTFGI
ncbi:MAG: PPOX class F420-dependent oxidoreductase [Thermomicrobiales bacterium]